MKVNTRRILALVLSMVVAMMTMCVSAEGWELWRGDSSNNGMVSSQTPRSMAEADVKWIADITDGWRMSSPVILGDNIFVATDVDFVTTDMQLKKIDIQTGEILGTVVLGGNLDYTVHLASKDSVIYVPLSGGAIQAVDGESMLPLWTSASIGEGVQNITPLCYDNGFIYTGTYGEGSAFYCINTEDTDAETDTEEKATVWTFADEENPTGHYWSGAAVSGDAVIFGGESGKLYSVNKENGELIDSYGASSAIRSSVMLSCGKAYFTSNDGTLYIVTVNDDGTFGDAVTVSLNATSCTSTPAMYNGRIYVGGGTAEGGVVSVVDAYAYELIYEIPMEASVNCSPLVTSAYADETQKTYIYVTYNNIPGGIKVIEDFYGNTEPLISDLYIPDDSGSNYCIDSVVADGEGNLYYHNDSGNLFALSKTEFLGAPVSLSVVPANAEVEIKDESGEIIMPTSAGNYDLPEGKYLYSASLSGYVSKDGEFEITTEQAEAHENVTLNISLVRKSSGGKDKDKVYFSLIGDTIHGSPDTHKREVKWIEKTKVYIEEDDTAFTVFDKVLSDNGFEYEEKSYNYISSITANTKFKNITLSEYDNGPGAGWMFTINDEYPMHGMREQPLKNGDKILVYYTDDYTLEPPSFPGSSGSGSGYVSGTVVGGGGKEDDSAKKEESEVKEDKKEEADVPEKEQTIPETESKEEIAITFKDVSKDHWASNAIGILASRGIIKGRDEDLFDPETNITRAEFVTFLARLDGGEIKSGDKTFADVDKGNIFSEYILWAASNGIVNGDTNGEFMPDKNISREEAAVIIERFMTYKEKALDDMGDDFGDKDEISSYAAESVKKIKGAGIMQGKGGNKFAPKDFMTRAEVAQILYRLTELNK